MTMKKAELEKRQGLKLANALRQAGNPYGPAQQAPADRRAQRDAARAAGLVPLAAKLPAELLQQLRARAQEGGQSMDELLAQLLREALQR